MTGDDNREDEFDPWEDLESTDSPGLEDGSDLDHDQEQVEQSDALVSDWLSDDIEEGDGASAPLGVFVPDEEHERPEVATEPIDENSAEDAVDAVARETDLAEVGEVAEGGSQALERVTSRDVVAVTAPPAVAEPYKRRGLRHVEGVIFGGLLAIPVTLGILIWGLRQDPLNLVKHVPESMASLFPAELRGEAGLRSFVPNVDIPAPVDDATDPAVDEGPVIVADEQPRIDVPEFDVAVIDSGDSSDATLVSDPSDVAAAAAIDDQRPGSVSQPDADVLDTPGPAETLDDASLRGPAAEPSTGPETVIAEGAAVTAIAPPASGLHDVLHRQEADPTETAESTTGSPVTSPVECEPPPSLDFSRVDESAVAAQAALETLEAFDRESADPARERERITLLVGWYRRLVAMAEACAGLEGTAADVGRPLAGPPEPLLRVQQEIVADPHRVEQLARLSRNWFSYSGRDGSGIMFPAVMAGKRQVGPYWCSTVAIAEVAGRSRDVAVVARTEPAAAPGDLVLVTGLIINGDVVWASDVRPATPEGVESASVDAAVGAEGESAAADPFSAPEP